MRVARSRSRANTSSRFNVRKPCSIAAATFNSSAFLTMGLISGLRSHAIHENLESLSL